MTITVKRQLIPPIKVVLMRSVYSNTDQEDYWLMRYRITLRDYLGGSYVKERNRGTVSFDDIDLLYNV